MVTKDFLVCVRCFTFNHAPYIEDAMNGFCLQQTSFPYVCVIVDDASTDGEQEVINNYIQHNFELADEIVVRKEETDDYYFTFAQHKTNKNCFFATYLLKYNHYNKKDKFLYFSKFYDNVKYHALCEGDDYWIYPLKLQRQVNVMEANSELSMCFHNAVVIYDDTPRQPRIFNQIIENKEIPLDNLISQWLVPTASMFYRNSCLPLFPVKEKIISGDLQMIIHFAGKGKVYALKDVMSIYRMTYNTDSMTSRNKNNNAFMCYQKHHILDCFDEYTQYKYHDIVGKYSKYWYDYSVFTERKNKSKLLAVLSMPIFVFKKVLKRY